MVLRTGVAGLLAAALACGGCAEYVIDEAKVFAPSPLEPGPETIRDEAAFADAAQWNAVWARKADGGWLAKTADPFAPTRITHGRTRDGQGVAWSLLVQEGEGRPLVVRCGGNSSTRQESGFSYAAAALSFGDVLLFDYPGSGETGGTATAEAFAASLESIAGVARGQLAEGRKLVLWGHSLGGVACAELVRLMPEASGVILETTARNAGEVAEAWTPWYVDPFVTIRIAPSLAHYDVAEALASFGGPVLVMGAARDKRLPVGLSRSLAEALKATPAKLTYVEFPDGEHSNSPGQPGFREAVGALFAEVARAG